MLEQLRRRRPLIRLELPRLARREHRHQSVPVIWAEVRRAVDQCEAGAVAAAAAAAPCTPAWVAARDHGALDLENVGRCGRHA